MKEGFRQSMAWLHTWAGLVFGWLLFAIFLTGTLSYFKAEINHWSQPEIPSRALNSAASLDLAQRYLQTHAAGAGSWFIDLPSEREPELSVSWRPAGGGRGDSTQKVLDPATGSELQARDSRGGDFFYRFHFQLQMPHPWGRWLSTFCALMMFVGLITGIITHKKIFKEFFTFRPGKAQRSWLDGHNAIGVLVLPFHLMISYSSLVIFMALVMPASIAVSYNNDTRAFFSDVFGIPQSVKATGKAAEPLPLSTLYAKVQEQVPGARIAWVEVQNPGDENARVRVTRYSGDRIAHLRGGGWLFDGVSGTHLSSDFADTTPMLISGGFYGLHLGEFAGPVLRWLYFFFGLAGTAVIGTGLVMWLGKRQLKHAKSGVQPFELRLVEVLNIASMSGLILAVAGFFWANRLIPAFQEGRADAEINTFFLIWGLSLLHALLRPGRKAWGEQLAVAAVFYLALPLINAWTTGQGLNHSIRVGDWSMAGFDLTALGCGLFLYWAARKMLLPPVVAPKRAPKVAKAAALIESEVK
ncbi:PepSY-associated TM helix domain-containing protein [Pseudomonas fontis]|uniref:PepSY domain-containing protein n=1 Tax=Pseudomonas fontis TaxID=2942633 RepID=A0ABT5NNR4_9PSED|nr:PepSY-associated TM helix domain-containing protein [Pseudomonas fontis]MDD0973047.1 PepSY domain-containing protein [Pseudomonas fontis]MDD0989816.1 PepSY domain-containing protein [Pseudomonas fontis]